jgi:hypothetical protein
LIHCVMPVSSLQSPVAWVRGKATPRPNLYSLTYRTQDTAGHPAVIYDSTLGPPSFTCTRELSDQEAAAFNPWNLLRAMPNGMVDDWDPAGARDKYEASGQGSSIFRMALTGANASVRTGGQGATLGATVLPARAADKTIKWSSASDLISLSQTTGPNVVVTGRNATGEAQYVPVKAMAANGFCVTAYVYVEPAYIDPPTMSAAPTLSAPTHGTISVSYTLNLSGKEDQSLISWFICDDAKGTNAKEVAVSRGNLPLKTYTLTPGDVGKYVKVGIQPKHQICDAGPAVFAVAKAPIQAADIKSPTVSPNFRNFVPTPTASNASGQWTVSGTWTIEPGEKFVNGYGIRAGSQGASLLYQQDAECGDMEVDLVMTPEKTAGMGFGSAGSPADGDGVQKSDIFIKYDPRTRNGYSLRYWRTTQSAQKCMYQLYKIENGVGSPLDERQVLTGVFKQNTHMTLKIIGTTFTVSARNDVDGETLSLEGTVTPNRHGGAGVYWSGSVPRGNSNVYSQIEISYPGAGQAPVKPPQRRAGR